MQVFWACGMAVVEDWEWRLLETENGCYWGKRVRGKNFFIFFQKTLDKLLKWIYTVNMIYEQYKLYILYERR